MSSTFPRAKQNVIIMTPWNVLYSQLVGSATSTRNAHLAAAGRPPHQPADIPRFSLQRVEIFCRRLWLTGLCTVQNCAPNHRARQSPPSILQLFRHVYRRIRPNHRANGSHETYERRSSLAIPACVVEIGEDRNVTSRRKNP